MGKIVAFPAEKTKKDDPDSDCRSSIIDDLVEEIILGDSDRVQKIIDELSKHIRESEFFKEFLEKDKLNL